MPTADPCTRRRFRSRTSGWPPNNSCTTPRRFACRRNGSPPWRRRAPQSRGARAHRRVSSGNQQSLAHPGEVGMRLRSQEANQPNERASGIAVARDGVKNREASGTPAAWVEVEPTQNRLESRPDELRKRGNDFDPDEVYAVWSRWCALTHHRVLDTPNTGRYIWRAR